MRLYILRHAETNKNRLKKSLTASDVYDKNSSLNDTGIFNAMKIGEFFKFESLKHNTIDVIYCSPALRCFKTAELIFQYCENQEIDIYCDDRLYSFDSMKDKLKLKIELTNFVDNILSKHNGKNVLIITHNHCIDVLHKIYVENLHDEEYTSSEYSSYKVDNCAMSCINFVENNLYDVEFWNRTLQTRYELVD